MAREFVDLTGEDTRELPVRGNSGRNSEVRRDSEIISLVSDDEASTRQKAPKKNSSTARGAVHSSQGKRLDAAPAQAITPVNQNKRGGSTSSSNRRLDARSPLNKTKSRVGQSTQSVNRNSASKRRTGPLGSTESSSRYLLDGPAVPGLAYRPQSSQYFCYNGVETRIPLHQDLLTRPTRDEDVYPRPPREEDDDALSRLNRAISTVANEQYSPKGKGRISATDYDATTERVLGPQTQQDKHPEKIGVSNAFNTTEDIQNAVSAQVWREASNAPPASDSPKQNHLTTKAGTNLEEPGQTNGFSHASKSILQEKAENSIVREDSYTAEDGILDDGADELQLNANEDLPETTQTHQALDSVPLLAQQAGQHSAIDVLELELKPVKLALKRCISLALEEQTPIAKTCLQQARVRASIQAVTSDTKTDPWANKISVSLSNPSQTVKSDARQLTTNVLSTSTGYACRNKGTLTVEPSHFCSSVRNLPKYKSIVRLGPNVLAENDRTMKYLPYFQEEEHVDGQKNDLRRELQQRFDDRVRDLPLVLRCAEKAEFYRDVVDDFIAEIGTTYTAIMYFLYHDDENWKPSIDISEETLAIALANPDGVCPQCGQNYNTRKWKGVLERLKVPSDRELVLASLAYSAFRDVLSFSIWHVISKDESILRMIDHPDRDAREDSKGMNFRCLTCGIYDCPTHGAYFEHSESMNTSEESESSDTDNELGHNFRQRINHPAPSRTDPDAGHLCGPYCVNPQTKLSEILGSHPGGKISGIYNQAQEAPGPYGLNDHELCDENCFWRTDLRVIADDSHPSQSLTIAHNNYVLKEKNYRFYGWRVEDVDQYKRILPVYVKQRRGPCLMAMSIRQSCLKIFVEMLFDMQIHQHTNADDPAIMVQPIVEPRDASYWVEHSITHLHDELNRKNDMILKGRCRNAMIQRDRPKHTWKGISEVHGWGLFAGEDIRPHEFIGEYKGEIISRAEADRRGAVYHHRGLEYLFTLNKDQDIDSSRAGNKMRFINNSDEPRNQNCYARKMFCNGVQRIGLFAKGPKTIEAGSELFFHYGYPREITKRFWEKGERPQRGIAMLKARATKRTGSVRAVKSKTQKPRKAHVPPAVKSRPEEYTYNEKGKAKAQEDDAESSLETKRRSQVKRKRVSSVGATSGDDLSDLINQDNNKNGGPSRPLRRRHESPPEVEIPEVPESGDEDYNAFAEDIEGSSDENNEDDQDDEMPKARRGPLRGGKGDGRYGGAMQRAGWITRKRNMEMSKAAEKIKLTRSRKPKSRASRKVPLSSNRGSRL
ncbi:MAG: hypothetical protein Q9227_004883 [Pyrenula ochraceoflavens]